MNNRNFMQKKTPKKREKWKNGLTCTCTQIINNWSILWNMIYQWVHSKTHTYITNTYESGHRQIEHNGKIKSVRPIKIFITQTDYSTAKPFNLIDYKSWTLAQASNKKPHIGTHTHKKRGRQRTNERKRKKKFAASMSTFYPYNWRLFHWTNTILLTTGWRKKRPFFHWPMANEGRGKTATPQIRNGQNALELQYLTIFCRNFN